MEGEELSFPQGPWPALVHVAWLTTAQQEPILGQEGQLPRAPLDTALKSFLFESLNFTFKNVSWEEKNIYLKCFYPKLSLNQIFFFLSAKPEAYLKKKKSNPEIDVCNCFQHLKIPQKETNPWLYRRCSVWQIGGHGSFLGG